jgi:hypothetical protein
VDPPLPELDVIPFEGLSILFRAFREDAALDLTYNRNT